MKYIKTLAGSVAFRQGDKRLSPAEKAILIMVDGNKDRANLCNVARSLGAADDSIIDRLLSLGLIEPSPESVAQAQAEKAAQEAARIANAGAETRPTAFMPSRLEVSSGFSDSALAADGAVSDLDPYASKREKLLSIRQFLLVEVKAHLGFFKGMPFAQGLDMASETDELRQISLDLAARIEKDKSAAVARAMLSRLEPLLIRPYKE